MQTGLVGTKCALVMTLQLGLQTEDSQTFQREQDAVDTRRVFTEVGDILVLVVK